MRPLIVICLVSIASRLAFAQTYTISTVTGNGTQGYAGDGGPAINAELYIAAGVATDPDNNLYIADFYLIRKVSNGLIATVAGNISSCLAAFPPPCGGFAGDNGPASSAKLNGANSIAVDLAGNLYIADGGNGRVRKVSTGVLTTVAGNGTLYNYSGDNGPATAAGLSNGLGVAVDIAGNLYIEMLETTAFGRSLTA